MNRTSTSEHTFARKGSASKRLSRTAKGIGIAFAASATMAVAGPTSALALEANGACPLAVNSWCHFTDNHSWRYDSAYWNGVAVPMCAKIVNASGNDNGTWSCQNASTVYSIYQPAYVGPNTWAHFANGNSGTTKTITGYATT